MNVETKDMEFKAHKGMVFNPDAKRTDIDQQKLYFAKYNGIWLVGRFQMQWYGWNFLPNLGCMSIQYDSLEELHEITGGLEQKKAGDAGSHVMEVVSKYLEAHPEEDD
jgi:hypothetical protein